MAFNSRLKPNQLAHMMNTMPTGIELVSPLSLEDEMTRLEEVFNGDSAAAMGALVLEELTAPSDELVAA